ncbi:ArnT family glycosyltransferase [Muriicola soli]|uniref:Glycosyltransferase n=1 Tax=Muriicola soli TaxID=2507538 RepID=A0A411ECP0_9FLAO|nr:glycosyltransferase family 39 protein [Muriicola soli]QBA65160.1 glycosyltransferase [Muriicola soli]
MPHKVITSLIPEYEKLKNGKVFLGLTLISILIRLPFFFRDYVDRDESTFILMAQSWVDGHLPYTQLWDLKPPLVFLFFAAIIYIFGKSFIAIRLFGALAVAGIAFFTFKIGKEAHSPRTAFWSAIGCVYLLSLFGSVQGVMSEHLSMLFFIPGLYLLIKFKKFRYYLLAGILMGISLMMKLNLAYGVMGIGIFILTDAILKKRIRPGIYKLCLLAGGILLVMAATCLPYAIAGISEVWIDSVILAPLAYSSDQQNSVLNVLPLCGILFLLGFLSWKKRWIDFKNREIQLLMIVTLGIVFSFIKIGRVNGHYLMQLYPMLLILTGIVLCKTVKGKPKYFPLVLVLTFLLPVESYLEYHNVLKNKIAYGTFYNGEGFTVPSFIKKNKLNQDEVLFFEYHIGYWLLNANPPPKRQHIPVIFADRHFTPILTIQERVQFQN